jgi:alpha-L-fucosidase
MGRSRAGANPKYADLYHRAAAPDDKEWYSKDPVWQREWFARIQDLVDRYQLLAQLGQVDRC